MAEESFKTFLGNLSRVKREELEDAIKKMATAREKYKQVVNEYYRKKQISGELFPSGREDSRENFNSDLRQYDELVEHCLRAGDVEILYEWGISPLRSGEGLSKLAAKNIQQYKDAFDRLLEQSKHPFEKICMATLRDTFQSLLENYGTLPKDFRPNKESKYK